jgi:hypothetical protein
MQTRVCSGGRIVRSGLLLATAWLALLAATAFAQEQDPAGAIAAAADWLVATHQNEDGGYTAFSSGAGQGPSDAAGTVDAILALAAVGRPVDEPLGFLESQPAGVEELLSQSGGSAGKLVLALAVAGAGTNDFAGTNPASRLAQQFAADGTAGVADPYNQALAILGLVAAGEAVPPAAAGWLRQRQEAGGDLAGSWDDGYGTAGNVDATAMAIMALHAAGASSDSAELRAAGDFLERVRLDSGGWGYAPGLLESANSTALALQAQSALGQDVGEAMAALLAWQQPSGAFAADFGDGPFDDFFTTLQALPALTGNPYPLVDGHAGMEMEQAEPAREQTNPAVAWILIVLALAGAGAVLLWARSGRGL